MTLESMINGDQNKNQNREYRSGNNNGNMNFNQYSNFQYLNQLDKQLKEKQKHNQFIKLNQLEVNE